MKATACPGRNHSEFRDGPAQVGGEFSRAHMKTVVFRRSFDKPLIELVAQKDWNTPVPLDP